MRKILLSAIVAMFSFVAMSQTVVFSDNFDSYTAGGTLVLQAGDTTSWTTWSDAPGSAEDAVISTDQASSGSNSLYVSGSNDIIYQFLNQTTGHYTIDFKYYVPSTGNGAYFNIQHYYAPGEEWAFECYFENDGTGYLLVSDDGSNTFAFNVDAWFNVSLDIDLTNDLITLDIDGTEVHSWPFSAQSSSTDAGVLQLGSINFYAGAPNNASGTYYVDDFVFTEIASALLPDVSVTPTEPISLELLESTTTRSLTITNDGGLDADYVVVSTINITNPITTSTDVVDSVSYYSEAVSMVSSLCMITNDKWEAAIRVPASRLQTLVGTSIDKVMVELSDSTLENAKVKIYSTGSLIVAGPGTLLHEQSFVPQDGVNYITLSTPIYVDGGDLWISVELDQPNESTSGVYVDVTEDCLDDNAYWYRQGVAWQQLTSIDESFVYAWMINVSFKGTAFTSWMSVDNASGNVDANSNATATVSFNRDAAAATDNRTGKIHVYTSDVSASYFAIDVTITAVSVNEFNNIEISVYPNPVSDFVNLSANGINKVEIFNMAGQKVFNGEYSNDFITIETADFEAGIYYVKVESSLGTTTQKIVIK